MNCQGDHINIWPTGRSFRWGQFLVYRAGYLPVTGAHIWEGSRSHAHVPKNRQHTWFRMPTFVSNTQCVRHRRQRISRLQLCSHIPRITSTWINILRTSTKRTWLTVAYVFTASKSWPSVTVRSSLGFLWHSWRIVFSKCISSSQPNTSFFRVPWLSFSI